MTPKFDLVPPQGLRLTPRHYAYLKISEGCNNRCSFCIIPSLRGDLVSRPAASVLYEAERLVKAGVKELLVISQDTSAYGVDIKYAAEQVPRPRRPCQVPRPCTRAGLTRRVGQAALCLSLSACRRRHSADGGGKNPPLSRHSLPACLAQGSEGDAPAGQSGEGARSHRHVAQGLPRSRHPLDLHRRLSRAKPRTISRSCSTGSRKRGSSASAASNTSRSQAPRPTTLAASCP